MILHKHTMRTKFNWYIVVLIGAICSINSLHSSGSARGG